MDYAFEDELENLVREGDALISQVRGKTAPSHRVAYKRDTIIEDVTSSLQQLATAGDQLTNDLDGQHAHLGKIQNLLQDLEEQIHLGDATTPPPSSQFANGSSQETRNNLSVHERLHARGTASSGGIVRNGRTNRMGGGSSPQRRDSAGSGGGASQLVVESQKRQIGRLRVQLLSLESENKKLSRVNTELDKQLVDTRRKLDYAQRNFKASTQRKYDMQSAKQYYDSEIDELSRLIDLVVDDQQRMREQMTAQSQKLQRQYEDLVGIARTHHRKMHGFRDAAMHLACKAEDRAVLRAFFRYWLLSHQPVHHEGEDMENVHQKAHLHTKDAEGKHGHSHSTSFDAIARAAAAGSGRAHNMKRGSLQKFLEKSNEVSQRLEALKPNDGLADGIQTHSDEQSKNSQEETAEASAKQERRRSGSGRLGAISRWIGERDEDAVD